MKAEGRNYQNFLIMNDLDFSTLPDSVKNDSDLMNLNINRMSGADYTEPPFENEQVSKDYLLFGKRPDQEEGNQEAPQGSYPAGPTITLKNLNMTGGSGASWIRALQGTLEGLRFENITWNNSGGGSYIGLIGRSTGTVNYVDFDRITIHANKASDYVGCIAYNQGDMEYVRAKDIQISNDPNTRTNYVGGLVGYGERPLEHCSAVGSEGDRGGSKDFTFKISINSETGRASEYTGGLAGRLNNNYARYCYVDCVSVAGRGYTGGLAGYAHQYYGTRDDSTVDDSIRRNEIFYYIQVTNSKVSGNYYTGGVFGTCSYITRAISMHNTVTQAESSSYGAGGVMATTGGWGLSWLYVEDCDVTTAGRAAGGISAYNDSYTQCVVKDSRVQAQTMAGGLAGVSPYTTYRCQVEGCEIKADTYAGGLIGYALSSGTSNYYIYDCVVNGGTTVTGTGAKVTGKGNYTGGLAGTMTGYMQTVVSPQTISSAIGSTVTLTYPNTVVNSIIVGGTVEGNAQTGGLIGQFDAGDRPINPDDGKPLDDIDSGYIGYINNQNYSKVLVAPVSVTGSSSVDAVYNSASTATGDGAGIGYLRVYEGIDGDVENEVKQMTKLSAKLNASNKKLTTEDQKKPIR